MRIDNLFVVSKTIYLTLREKFFSNKKKLTKKVTHRNLGIENFLIFQKRNNRHGNSRYSFKLIFVAELPRHDI